MRRQTLLGSVSSHTVRRRCRDVGARPDEEARGPRASVGIARLQPADTRPAQRRQDRGAGRCQTPAALPPRQAAGPPALLQRNDFLLGRTAAGDATCTGHRERKGFETRKSQ